MCFFMQAMVLAQVPTEEWLHEYEQAQERARQSGKPMLIMFSSQWCPPCKTMTTEVLPKEPVREEIQSYIALYLDAAVNEPLFKKYNVETEPTFVVMDPSRSERDRMLGLVQQDLFASRLRFWNKIFELEEQLNNAPNEAELWRLKGRLLGSQMHLNQAREAFARAVAITEGGVAEYKADMDFMDLIASRSNTLEQLESKLDMFKTQYPTSARVQDIVFVRSLIARQRGQQEVFIRLLDKYSEKADPNAMFGEQAGILLRHMREQARGGDKIAEPESGKTPDTSISSSQ